MTLLAFSFWQWSIGLAMVFVCLLLILVILGQPGSSGGLAGAFGGGGGSAFGARTGDAFTWITVGLAFCFLMLSVLGNYAYKPRTGPGQMLIATPPAGEDGSAPAEPDTGIETDAGIGTESGDAKGDGDGETP